jgi:hypothetical protein
MKGEFQVGMKYLIFDECDGDVLYNHSSDDWYWDTKEEAQSAAEEKVKDYDPRGDYDLGSQTFIILQVIPVVELTVHPERVEVSSELVSIG